MRQSLVSKSFRNAGAGAYLRNGSGVRSATRRRGSFLPFFRLRLKKREGEGCHGPCTAGRGPRATAGRFEDSLRQRSRQLAGLPTLAHAVAIPCLFLLLPLCLSASLPPLLCSGMQTRMLMKARESPPAPSLKRTVGSWSVRVRSKSQRQMN